MGKKVLLISHYPPPSGGIASWSKRLLEVGLSDGWEIDHVNSNTIGGRDPFKNTKRNYIVEWKRSRNIWKKEKEFLKTDSDIEVVHTCIPCTPFGMIRERISAKIAKKHGKKFILHCRCTVPNVVNKGWKLKLWKRLTKYCDGVMVLNTASQEFAQKHSPNSKTVLIPNFVLANELVNNSEKTFNEHIKNVLYVGGVTKEKGCDTIIEAARLLPEITFHLVGIVSKEVAEMEKTPNVILHGNQDKEYIMTQLKNADCFVFLSRYFGEGFSNALAEAMGAGLPCIVTDWAANSDMIGSNGGMVVSQQSPDELVKAINELDMNVELRKAMAKHNIEKVRNEYVESAVIPQYTEFYEKLISN